MEQRQQQGIWAGRAVLRGSVTSVTGGFQSAGEREKRAFERKEGKEQKLFNFIGERGLVQGTEWVLLLLLRGTANNDIARVVSTELNGFIWLYYFTCYLVLMALAFGNLVCALRSVTQRRF